MKTVKELQQIQPIQINYSRIRPGNDRATQFALTGELGFRLNRAAHRIENELPYSHEYLLSQISGDRDQWSNFPRVHADIAGRWILAETYIHAGKTAPPAHLADIIDAILDLQNADGSFGIVPFEEEPLNMHKAYGNGWMIKALAQYAITFDAPDVRAAAIKMGDFYERTFPLWDACSQSERDTQFYAISISCYYHAFDGIVTLYQLTGAERWLDLLAKFIPNLTPLEEADHSHMYLTIRRGLLKYYQIKGMAQEIETLSAELQHCFETCILETGGVPERFWLPENEHADDEACSLFDWELLTTHLFELTGDTRWLDYAILNLENQIFYNQTYNGGFGSCEIQDVYKQQGKESPWCCSVYGPYGLVETGAALVHFAGNVVRINHLISGSFTSKQGDKIFVERDDAAGTFTLDRSQAPNVRQAKIYNPHWLQLSADTGKLDGEWFVIDLDSAETEPIVLNFHYRIWLSPKAKPPQHLQTIPDNKPFVLFYGPWMLTHRFHDKPIRACLELDEAGYVINTRRQFLRGMNFYGESTRVIISAERHVEPYDTFRGVYENDGELYLYPLKDKESPNQSNPTLFG